MERRRNKKNMIEEKGSILMHTGSLLNVLQEHPDLPVVIYSHLNKNTYEAQCFSSGPVERMHIDIMEVLDVQLEGEERMTAFDEENFWTELYEKMKAQYGDVKNLDDLTDAEFDKYVPYWRKAIVVNCFG